MEDYQLKRMDIFHRGWWMGETKALNIKPAHQSSIYTALQLTKGPIFCQDACFQDRFRISELEPHNYILSE